MEPRARCCSRARGRVCRPGPAWHKRASGTRGQRVNGRTIELGSIALRLVQLLTVALVVFHLVHLFFASVFMDEAYYWMWGQHPALSYYDHPPLNAWLLGLSSMVFGWNLLALRVPVVLSFLADIYALYLLSRAVAGDAWRTHFWVTLLLFVGSPIYWMVSGYALPDHLLLTGCLYALYFFFRFFAARAGGGGGASRDLYLGALFLGLAALSKYNAAFLALGVAAFVLVYDRRLLKEGRLYLAALLTLLLQAPTILWNLSENFASWEFILKGRHAGLHAEIDGIVPLVFGIGIFISPFLFWPIWKFATSQKNSVPGAGFARATFLISTAAIFTVALTTVTLFHWNLVAYVAMLPFLALVMRPRLLLGLQAIYGTIFAVFIFINYTITPLTNVDGWRDGATAWSYGWGPTVAALDKAKAEHKVGFIATSDYTTAALVGFMSNDRDVTSLFPGRDQYDFWFDPKAHAGEDAILFEDTWRPLYDVASEFRSLTVLAELPVVVNGRQVDLHRILLGTDFTPHE